MAVIKEEVSCLICGNECYKELRRYVDLVLNEEICYVECTNCHLIYMNPRPTESGISGYYPDNYYAHKKLKLYIGGEKTDLINRIKNKIMAIAIWLNMKKHHSLIYYFLNFIMIIFLDIIAGNLGIPRKRKGKMLDVGCGDGFHMFLFKKAGYEVFGIEKNIDACETAKECGLNVFCGDIIEAKYPDESFDIVRLIGVLEHIHNPVRYLKEIKRILKKDGEVIINCPDYQNPWSKIFGKNSLLLTDSTHIYIFSNSNIKILLQKIGFQRIKIKKIASRIGLDSLANLIGKGLFSKIIVYNPVLIFLFTALDLFFYFTGIGAGAMTLSVRKN